MDAGVFIHSCALTVENKLIFKHFFSPVEENNMQRVFSICKSFTGLGVGLLADEGKINLDDPICNYFPEYLPNDPHEWLLSLKIRDILQMKTCHIKSTYDKFDMNSNWNESFFIKQPTKAPGTSFDYDTSGAHILCSLVEKLTKMNLLDYIRYRLPELGLSEEAYTLLDPQGFSQGGTGLMCSLSDMLAFGNLLLYVNIPGQEPDYLSDFMITYLKDATSFHSDTTGFAKSPFESFGYGYQLWMADHEGFTCYGLGGQFIMVHPKQKLVLACTADNIGKSSLNQFIFDYFYKDILEKVTQTPIHEIIEAEQNSTFVPKLMALQGNWHSINRQQWHILGNVSSFKYATLEVLKDSGLLILEKNDISYEIPFAYGDNVTFTLNGYNMKCAASAAFSSDNQLNIHISILDTSLGSISITLDFTEDTMTINSVKREETLFDEFCFTAEAKWFS